MTSTKPHQGWRTDPNHPRFLVKGTEQLSFKCPSCGKQSPKRTFEEFMHFNDCPTGLGKP